MKDETIRVLAHRYWNYDEIPPEDYITQVMDYIKTHPKEFKGVVPQ